MAGERLMQLPYGLQTYSRLDLPRVKLVNYFVEQVPDRVIPGNLTLVPRPGLADRFIVGSGPINGLLYQSGSFDNDQFIVSGQNLHRTGYGVIGTLDNDGRVQMAVADTTILIATGDTFYRSDGATVTTISFPDSAGVQSVTYLGGYTIAARASSRRVYFTLDPTTWDGLDYFSAEQSTDFILGVVVVVDQLWVFCRRHVEIFFLSGDADAPFQRVQGRVLDKGALTRDSIVKMDNTVLWVGHEGVVYRAEGTPIRISDHGIEERIQAAGRSVSAFTIMSAGHLFYVLQLPAETLAYDVATRQWTQFATGDGPWSPCCASLFNQTYILGDSVTGQIYNLDESAGTDLGTPIERYFTAIINDSGFVDSYSFDCSIGTGSIALRTSRDGGASWTDWRSTSLAGSARTRARFTRLGMVDQGNLIVQSRVIGDGVPTVRYVRVNEVGGGRSR